MDVNNIASKLKGTKLKVVNPKLAVTFVTQPDGSTVITIPPSVGSEYVYESAKKESKDETTGKVKTTGGNPMVYCVPAGADGKANRITIPLTVTQGEMRTKLLMRPGGFFLMVNDISSEEE